MSVRAKFTCNKITLTQGSKATNTKDANGNTVYEPCVMKTIEFTPTYSNDPNSENKKFWDATPGGHLSLNCVNPAAAEQFELGKSYYLDFTPCEG